MKFKQYIYHLLFWVFIFFYIFDYFKDSGEYLTAVQNTLIEVVMYMLISYVNLWLLIPKFIEKKVLYILSLLIFMLVLLGIYHTIGLEKRLMGEESMASKISFCINFISFGIYSFLYWYVEKFQQEKQRSLQLENEKLMAEMKALKSQVSPHFLFNSLNNIYSLCLTNTEGAAMMVEKLSDVLRYLIYEGPNETVSLEKEANMIGDYVALQKMKQPESASNITYTVDNDLHRYSITPLLLISLVENAFTHGNIFTDEQGKVNIAVKANEDKISVEISNTIDPGKMKAPSTAGVGLKNVREQLKLHYPDRHQFEAGMKDDWFHVKLEVYAG